MARLLGREVRREGARGDEFAGREDSMAYYLRRARGRFAESLAVLPEGARVLELGADPWFFTQLLAERGVVPLTSGQRPGVWVRDESPPDVQRVSLRWGASAITVQHHLFDVERDRWPFEDGAFDVVLCMEVLEHLTYSPAHLLHEANRVLGAAGALLLTTPNALAATKLARLLRGRSPGARYSGYGPGGRHNREFTPAEVRAVLELANFTPAVTTRNIAGYAPEDRLAAGLRAIARPGRRDHIFATAVKAGPPRLAFPGWLYADVYPERMRAGGVSLV